MSNSTKIIIPGPLIINGHTLDPIIDELFDVHGHFELSRRELGAIDLSTLRIGPAFVMKGRSMRPGSNPISITGFSVELGPKIVVKGRASLCSGPGWNHALDRVKCLAIGENILKNLQATRSDFTFGGNNRFKLHFTQIIKGGSFSDVEQQVQDTVGMALQPLLDFRNSMDAECKNNFGV